MEDDDPAGGDRRSDGRTDPAERRSLDEVFAGDGGVEGSSTPGVANTSLDLLDRRSYRRNHPGIVQFRNFVRNNEVRIRVLENDEPVTLTAD